MNSCDQGGYGYARFLLDDKRREFQALESRRRRDLIPDAEYQSCHRSLLQAIGQLETLLLNDPEHEKKPSHSTKNPGTSSPSGGVDRKHPRSKTS